MERRGECALTLRIIGKVVEESLVNSNRLAERLPGLFPLAEDLIDPPGMDVGGSLLPPAGRRVTRVLAEAGKKTQDRLCLPVPHLGDGQGPDGPVRVVDGEEF